MEPNQKPEAAPVAPHADAELLAGLEAEAYGATTATATAAPQTPQIPTSQILEGILGPGFMVLAPAWNVRPGEVKQLATAYGVLLDKYFPEGMGDYGAEIAAVLVTLAVVGPRLRMPRKLEEEKPKEGASAGAG